MQCAGGDGLQQAGREHWSLGVSCWIPVHLHCLLLAHRQGSHPARPDHLCPTLSPYSGSSSLPHVLPSYPPGSIKGMLAMHVSWNTKQLEIVKELPAVWHPCRSPHSKKVVQASAFLEHAEQYSDCDLPMLCMLRPAGCIELC